MPTTAAGDPVSIGASFPMRGTYRNAVERVTAAVEGIGAPIPWSASRMNAEEFF